MSGAVLPRVASRYGAPMGRVDTLPGDYAGPVRVARVRLNSGGYDSGGAYWGLGPPLYQAREDRVDAPLVAYYRAPGATARDVARSHWPAATVR